MSSELDLEESMDMRNEVRERRADRGMSQAQLAEAMRVSRQTINSIETGRYIPSLPLAMALARYFETTVEDLFDDDGDDGD
jgi:putative transcriptional regulator